MSPNAYVSWCDEKRMLCGYQGEEENEKPVFVWDYSVFEEYNGEAVTPSMYEFLSAYIQNNITKKQLYEIQGDDYCPGDLEEEAVNAYYQVPILTRTEMHKQMLINLYAEHHAVSAKETAAINWMLDDDKQPFDITSPIYTEVCNFVRKLTDKYKSMGERLRAEIDEEEQWWSGAEEGAEGSAAAAVYDSMEEP
jgi:hypothetical protein